METIIDNMTNYSIERVGPNKGGFIRVELKKTDTTPSTFSFLLGQKTNNSIMNVNSNIKNDNIEIKQTSYIPEKRQDYFKNMKVNLVTISGLDVLQTDDIIFSGKSDSHILFSTDFKTDTFKLYTYLENPPPKSNKKLIIGVFILFLLIILGFLYKKYK